MVVAGMVVALAVLQPRLPSLLICCAATGVVCLYCFNLHGVLVLFFVYCIVLLWADVHLGRSLMFSIP